MTTIDDYRAEAYARKHLRASGIVETLKAAGVIIWTIRAGKQTGHTSLSILVDTTALPNADMAIIRDEIQTVLAPLKREIDVTASPMETNCCYGACHGCLNGDPAQRIHWVT